MAIIKGSGFVRWDTTTNAAFDGTNGPRIPMVKQVWLESPSAGTFALQVGGLAYLGAGTPISLAAGAVMFLDFNPPQAMPGLALTTLTGANNTVTVTYA